MIEVYTNRGTRFGDLSWKHGTPWILECRSSRNSQRENHSSVESDRTAIEWSHFSPNIGY